MLVLFSSQKVQMLVCYWWGFSTWDTGVAVSENKSILLTFERQGVFKFGKFFKSFAGTALFLGSVLTVYQTATSKIITYLSWGEGLLLCSGIIFRGKLGWKSKCTLWWSVTGLKIKLLSFLFHVVSDLLRFHVSETLSWSTIFWRTFEG